MRDAFVRTNRRAVAMMFVRLFDCLSVKDWCALWSYGSFYRWSKFIVVYSNALGAMILKHVHPHPVVFFQFHLEERWCMDGQTRCDISRTVEDRG